MTVEDLMDLLNDEGGAVYFPDGSALATSTGGNIPRFYPDADDDANYQELTWEQALHIYKEVLQ